MRKFIVNVNGNSYQPGALVESTSVNVIPDRLVSTILTPAPGVSKK